jgi:hypothetical protein
LDILALGIAVSAVSIWQFASIQRAQASIAIEDAYRRLAEESGKTHL